MSEIDVISVDRQIVVVNLDPEPREAKVFYRIQQIIVESPNNISIVGAGPPGPRGFPGPEGPPGISANASFTHDQSVPSDSWGPIEHMLGFNPAGFVLEDTSGNVFEGFVVEYIDTNHLIIHLGAAFAGRIRMS